MITGSEHLSDLFDERVRVSPDREAYRQFDPEGHEWVGYSWAQMQSRIQRWRSALSREQLPPGSRIAILLPNGIDHVCMDQAALSLGCVPVPLHVVDNPDSIAFILGDCGAALLIVDTASRWELLAPLQTGFPALKRVLYVAGQAPGAGTSIELPVRSWLGEELAGVESRVDNNARSLFDEQVALPDQPDRDPDSLAAIVYTSGTTGRPKGVMLTHRNVLSNVHAILRGTPVLETDIFLSFLPLSHTLERTVGYYLPIAAGAAVAFARSIQELSSDMRVIRPTALVSVPRIYERAHSVLRSAVQGSRLSKRLFDITVRLGYRRFEAEQGRVVPLSLFDRVRLRMLDGLVARRVRNQFGGRLRLAVTGGAAMSSEVAIPLLAMGLPLLQGYGMTESSPVVSCNTPGDNDPSTVGRPLPGVEVRIGEQDELLTRSASVMRGYWNRPDDSARAIDPDGWLHTGDQGEIVQGRVRIKGRIKDIIVTSTGEKISPVDIENAIAADPFFEQVVLLGEQRPYLIALLVINAEKWKTVAASLGLDGSDAGQLRSAPAVRWALERIAARVKGFPSYSAPKAVFLSTEPWTVANGLITPTLKPKRPALFAHYAEEIARLYAGH